jgi:hypothetical protein
MRHLDPGCRGWAMARGRRCLDGKGSLSVDEPIGVIDVHSSVLGGTLAPITLPENNTGTDIAEWRSL